MNSLTIAGTLGRDAELRRTQGGDAVVGFSVAVDNGKDKNGQKRDATWFDCSLWGKRGEALAQYLKKGTKVALQGRVSAREHNGKAYLQLSVSELTFQGGGEQRGYDSQAPISQAGYDPNGNTDPAQLDDDLPF